jgi:hypothetical protein
VSSVLALVLIVLGGVLVGGAWSLRQQGAGRGAVGLMVVLAVLALAAGVAWWWP